MSTEVPRPQAPHNCRSSGVARKAQTASPVLAPHVTAHAGHDGPLLPPNEHHAKGDREASRRAIPHPPLHQNTRDGFFSPVGLTPRQPLTATRLYAEPRGARVPCPREPVPRHRRAVGSPPWRIPQQHIPQQFPPLFNSNLFNFVLKICSAVNCCSNMSLTIYPF